MNLLRSLLRDSNPFSFQQYVDLMTYGGATYGFTPNTTYGTNRQEEPPGTFEGVVQAAYKANGIVFACMTARMLLFAEARFQYRRLESGRPGELFGSTDLRLLEKPWPNGTTGDLLGRMIQNADLLGNFFAAKRANRIKILRPDWVTIILGSHDDPNLGADDLDADVVGYAYYPGGRTAGKKAIVLLPNEVAHFAPIPDPAASYRGMSWLTPIIREVMGDNAARDHKLKFFEQGATPNLAVSLDQAITVEQFKEFKEDFKAEHGKGYFDAYKTLYLGGGAKVEVIGKDMQQLDFKVTQGAGETRIAAAAGIPPVIVGLSEGLASATYSNYASARRRFADMTMRPMWRNAAASLSTIVRVPPGAELWYDDRDIPALQEDTKDAASIQGREASTIKTLIDAGYTPDSVVAAVKAGDFGKLVHTGLFSVQLQAPGDSGGDGPVDNAPDDSAPTT